MSWLDDHWYDWISEPNSGCFIWLGTVNKNRQNRPMAYYNNKSMTVNRIVCIEENGPPPFPNAEAAHRPPCDNILCVNGAHTYWASRTQNERDKPKELRARVAGQAGHFGGKATGKANIAVINERRRV